jgi:Fur family ferric uptake transcriptional regulator
MPHRGWWHGRLRGYGYRLTVPREMVLAVLSRSRKHLSAEEIYMAVHKVNPEVGLASIYRTLDMLTQMRIVNKFEFGEGKARYEMSLGPKHIHHHHLVCRNCLRVIDYSDFGDEEKSFLDNAQKALERKYKFKITSHQIRFYGLCEKCQKGGV